MGMISILVKWFFTGRRISHNIEKFGICPKCKGTGRIACLPKIRTNFQRNGWYGYDPITNTIDCSNCGAQYQYSKSTGIVKLNTHGKPCLHQYASEQLSSNIHRHHCIHCGDEYYIKLDEFSI